jgi:N-sulfoglucosamine sulfohydrolase
MLLNPKLETRDHIIGEHNWHDYQAHERSVRTKEYLYVHNAFPELSGTPPADAVRSPTYRTMQQLRDADTLSDEAGELFDSPRPSETLFDFNLEPQAFNNRFDNHEYAAQIQALREYYKN